VVAILLGALLAAVAVAGAVRWFTRDQPPPAVLAVEVAARDSVVGAWASVAGTTPGPGYVEIARHSATQPSDLVVLREHVRVKDDRTFKAAVKIVVPNERLVVRYHDLLGRRRAVRVVKIETKLDTQPPMLSITRDRSSGVRIGATDNSAAVRVRLRMLRGGVVAAAWPEMRLSAKTSIHAVVALGVTGYRRFCAHAVDEAGNATDKCIRVRLSS
jgi:hypothetical protein